MSADWPRVPLGEVLQLQRRWVKVEATETYHEIGVRCFGNGIFHKPPISGLTLGGKRVLAIHPGDLVLNNVFAWEGAVAVAGPTEVGKIGSHRFVTATPVSGRCETSYLRWFFVTKSGLDVLRKASPGSAGRNRTLNLDQFFTSEILLPPLAEQRRIVERVEAIASRIAEAKRLRDEANAEGSRLLIQMAHRADLADSEKQANGWRLVTLGEALTLASDPVKVDSSASYPNLGIYSFANGLFHKPPISGLETSAATLYRVRAGQFIYSRLFAFEGSYGRVTPEFDGLFVSNEYPTFDCKQGTLRAEFLAAYFKAKHIWATVAVGSQGLGDRRQRVQPKQLLAHKIWLPPIAWQDRIADVWAKLDSAGALQSETATELDALLPSVLNRAFAGEL